MIRPSLDEFRRRAARGNLVPVSLELLADLETPVSVFRKLNTSPYAFLLESVENGEQLGRYSFLGADPLFLFTARGNEQTIRMHGDQLSPVEPRETPMATLRALMARYTPVPDPTLPPFVGGAVGFMGYDTIRQFEAIPDSCTDDLGLPEHLFMVADSLVAFDHVKRRMQLIVNAHVEGDADAAYEGAVARLMALRARVMAPAGAPTTSVEMREPAPLSPSSNMTPDQFKAMVARAKEHIQAGDIFQVVLSQRFSVPVTCAPFDVYRALRAVNPSPYMFYLSCGGFQLAGSSPEILVRCQDGRVNLRPIAGTRPRGATPEEDKALELDLLADEKEIAEHVMLVDLGRNDLGRVSRYGTVRVRDFKIIERYSHVMHIVSDVVGELAHECDAFDVLAASFPAGTVSGAPKIRAMEIIDELEPTRRGPYAGAVVYVGFNGSMDSCITIRTALLKDGTAYVQAGAGIVADSVPENEFQETANKARGMIRALEMAEHGLD
jgi:anthranilate synthase component 1